LPEIAQLAELSATRQRLDDQRRDAQILVDDLTVEQEKVDADVEAVKARRTRDRERMDAGLISNPKDLERMTHELASLERRIGSLEDDELEIMARLEDAQRTLDELAGEITATDERAAGVIQLRDEKAATLRDDLARAEGERGPAAEGLPADLVGLYDKLRASKAGIGAALLRARQCGGCRLTLDPGELSAIRAAAPDEVVRCEQCQRILVRTAESGL